MTEALRTAARLARKEKTTRRGRRGYTDELKDKIREAAKDHSKSEIGKRTGISFPTLQRIIGPTRKSTKVRRRRSFGNGRRRSSKPSGAVSVQISVTLPSGAHLSYTDVPSLRADAGVLGQVAKDLG